MKTYETRQKLMDKMNDKWWKVMNNIKNWGLGLGFIGFRVYRAYGF